MDRNAYINATLTELKAAIRNRDTSAPHSIFVDFAARYPADADAVLNRLIQVGHAREAESLRRP